MPATSDISVQLKGVPETLLITLYARAAESQKSEPILQDPKAVEIAHQLDYDFSKFEPGWSSQLGCVIRAGHIDRIVQVFIKAHPEAVVINLGAGLCTRYSRLETAQVRWYDIDFPEVIELRRQLFEESDRNNTIASSLLDFTWMDAIDHQPNQPVITIYEGVSMYLSEADNRALLEQLEHRFGFANVVFDVLNQKAAGQTRRHDTVSKTSAQFQWGIDRSCHLETWNPNFVLKEEQFYLQHFLDYPQRLPTTWRVISQLLPALPMALFKNSGRIVRLQLGPEPI